MTAMPFLKSAGAVVAATVLTVAGMSITSPLLRADSHGDSDDESDSTVQTGFRIAPVPLNLKGKNRALVGKGSYIVNAQADCNGCHNSPDLGGEFDPNGVPYFGEKTIINKKGYLGGGMDFGPFPSDTPPGAFPHIFSRNLTPDVTGLPEGGHSFAEFRTILRTGHDFDGVHPTCTGAPNGSCLPPPFDGRLLQIMPWPVYAKMSEDDIRAIYEYLSAIPCISHADTIGLPANLYQTCPRGGVKF